MTAICCIWWLSNITLKHFIYWHRLVFLYGYSSRCISYIHYLTFRVSFSPWISHYSNNIIFDREWKALRSKSIAWWIWQPIKFLAWRSNPKNSILSSMPTQACAYVLIFRNESLLILIISCNNNCFSGIKCFLFFCETVGNPKGS